MQARDPFVDAPDSAPDGRFADPASYDFSVAWMTDTQYLSEGQVAGQPLSEHPRRRVRPRSRPRDRRGQPSETVDGMEDEVALVATGSAATSLLRGYLEGQQDERSQQMADFLKARPAAA